MLKICMSPADQNGAFPVQQIQAISKPVKEHFRKEKVATCHLPDMATAKPSDGAR